MPTAEPSLLYAARPKLRAMRQCPCGKIECVGLVPMSDAEAERAAYAPCVACGNRGDGRVFWFGRRPILVSDNGRFQ